MTIAAKHNPFASNEPGVAKDVDFAIGAENANAITVSLQLKDQNGEDLAQRGVVDAYISSSAGGDDLANAITSIAAGTDGVYMALIAARLFRLVSEEDGDIDVVLTYSGGALTIYLNVILSDGSIVSSPAITFAA